MTKERVLLLRKECYASACNSLYKSLSNLGYIVDCVDDSEEYREIIAKKTVEQDYLAVVSFDEIINEFDVNYVKDTISCCLMNIHPVYMYYDIAQADDRVLVLNNDLKNTEYIMKYCSNIGSVGFFSGAGECIDGLNLFQNRTYDIVYEYTYENSGVLYNTYKDTASETDLAVVDAVIDIMKKKSEYTMQDAFNLFLNRVNAVELPPEGFYLLMYQLRFIDTYMKAWINEQVIRSIVDSGIKLHVFGEGWDKFECEHPENLVIMGGTHEDYLNVLANAKIALNVMPWLRGGFHERIASGMLCGAVALTDTSTYIEENFTDDFDIAIYDRDNQNSVGEKINELLANPEKAEKIAKAGYEKAHKEHTWENRAKEIMECIHDTVNWRKEALTGKQ